MPAEAKRQEREAAAAAGAAGISAAHAAAGRPFGQVEVGMMAGRQRAPTTAATHGVRDQYADRRTALGCAFLIPKRTDGRRDERYRTSVVRAEGMLLAALELEARGRDGTAVGVDARRIAAAGPGGRGWLIGGRWVTLPTAEEVLQRDPRGMVKWVAVQRLGAEVEQHGASLRLICHCRWTRL